MKRAVICYPEKHIAGVLKGGKRPRYNNPNYEIVEQYQPTPDKPMRRHHIRATHMRGAIK